MADAKKASASAAAKAAVPKATVVVPAKSTATPSQAPTKPNTDVKHTATATASASASASGTTTVAVSKPTAAATTLSTAFDLKKIQEMAAGLKARGDAEKMISKRAVQHTAAMARREEAHPLDKFRERATNFLGIRFDPYDPTNAEKNDFRIEAVPEKHSIHLKHYWHNPPRDDPVIQSFLSRKDTKPGAVPAFVIYPPCVPRAIMIGTQGNYDPSPKPDSKLREHDVTKVRDVILLDGWASKKEFEDKSDPQLRDISWRPFINQLEKMFVWQIAYVVLDPRIVGSFKNSLEDYYKDPSNIDAALVVAIKEKSRAEAKKKEKDEYLKKRMDSKSTAPVPEEYSAATEAKEYPTLTQAEWHLRKRIDYLAAFAAKLGKARKGYSLRKNEDTKREEANSEGVFLNNTKIVSNTAKMQTAKKSIQDKKAKFAAKAKSAKRKRLVMVKESEVAAAAKKEKEKDETALVPSKPGPVHTNGQQTVHSEFEQQVQSAGKAIINIPCSRFIIEEDPAGGPAKKKRMPMTMEEVDTDIDNNSLICLVVQLEAYMDHTAHPFGPTNRVKDLSLMYTIENRRPKGQRIDVFSNPDDELQEADERMYSRYQREAVAVEPEEVLSVSAAERSAINDATSDGAGSSMGDSPETKRRRLMASAPATASASASADMTAEEAFAAIARADAREL